MCFVWISEQTAIISLYSINRLVFITETECVYCAVRTGSLPSKAQWLLYVPPGLTYKNSTFCPHNVFLCFVWIWEQTTIISLHSVSWLVFVTQTDSVYCAVRSEPSQSKAQWLLHVPQGLTFNVLRSAHTVYLCVFCESQNKQRLFPCTALTGSFYSLDGVFTARHELDL
jgi:hypothetical protein